MKRKNINICFLFLNKNFRNCFVKSSTFSLYFQQKFIFIFLIGINFTLSGKAVENFTCDVDAFKASVSLSVYIKGSTCETIRRYLEKFNSMTLD